MPRIVLLLLTILFAGAADAATLRERLTPDVLAVVMPGAERLGTEEGSPPAIAVYKGGDVVAYLFSTLDVVRASGYSSVPFDVIAGVDIQGRITGAKAVFHAEPFVLNDPIRQPQLDTFLKREAGTSIRGGVVPALTPDFVAGATVTARAMRGAVADAARLVLRARISVPQVSEPTLNREQYPPRVVGRSAGRRRGRTAAHHGVGEVAAALGTTPDGAPDAITTDLYAALLTPAALGGSLIGLNRYNEYMRRFPPGAQVIALASSGPYDFLGDDYVRASKGYRFDRIRADAVWPQLPFRQRRFPPPRHPRARQWIPLAAIRRAVRAAAGIRSVAGLAVGIAGARGREGSRVPAALPAAGELCADAGAQARAALGRGAARLARLLHRDPCRRADRADLDLRLPGSACALARGAPRRARRISAVRSRLARLDRGARSSRSST